MSTPPRDDAADCPACGREVRPFGTLILDADGRPVTGSAEPHDVTFCGHCLALLVYDEHLRLRRISAAEREELARDQPGLAGELYAAQARQFHKGRAGKGSGERPDSPRPPTGEGGGR